MKPVLKELIPQDGFPLDVFCMLVCSYKNVEYTSSKRGLKVCPFCTDGIKIRVEWNDAMLHFCWCHILEEYSIDTLSKCVHVVPQFHARFSHSKSVYLLLLHGSTLEETGLHSFGVCVGLELEEYVLYLYQLNF